MEDDSVSEDLQSSYLDSQTFLLSNYKKKNLKEFNIYELLDNFVQSEELNGDNKWFSPYMNKNVDASKHYMIFNSPKILMIQIKRFNNMSNKLDNKIDFPITDLNIRPYLHTNNISKYHLYDLIGIINHTNFSSYGFSGISFGHYYSYCKNEIDKKWYKFDDDSINEIDEDKIITKNAYILFYQAKDIE